MIIDGNYRYISVTKTFSINASLVLYIIIIYYVSGISDQVAKWSLIDNRHYSEEAVAEHDSGNYKH